MVEYEDEFGRMRKARKSEVPRHLVKRDDEGPSRNEEEVEYVFLSSCLTCQPRSGYPIRALFAEFSIFCSSARMPSVSL